MLRFAPDRRSSFPQDDYTPFGYLYTPHHTGVTPDGLLRSVPPTGFGLYRRGFTWYGMENMNGVNHYVSLLRPCLNIGGTVLAEEEDFKSNGVALVSHYHSSNILSYDFAIHGVQATLAWYSDTRKALYCRVALENTTDHAVPVRMDAAHVYGMNGRRWWGSDAITARYVAGEGAVVSKILAYGDVFALSADLAPDGAAITAREAELDAHRREGLALPCTPTATAMPGPLHAAIEWAFTLGPGERKTFTVALCRDVNEKAALQTLRGELAEADRVLTHAIDDDNRFFDAMPALGEGWPAHWRRGMVYHYQTLRMNIYPPKGIFTHRWDGMQTANPRLVLGETCIDVMSLQYADIETALEVLTTTFVDTPDDYVPCCREDGSVNMIGMDGSECATALMWGFPWKTIRTALAQSRNVAWLRRLYPHLKKCIAWWEKNRTDADGWYHCNNSWESGQDGSKRFVTDTEDGCPEGMNADFVRAVDIESIMAQTAGIMAEFAELLDEEADARYYRAMHETGVSRVSQMFDGDRFRDINALTGKFFTADAHDDPMLCMPLATAQATAEQAAACRWMMDGFERVAEAREFLPSYCGIFWPPIFQTLLAAMQNAGRPGGAAHVFAILADTAWRRDDSRETWPLVRTVDNLPDKYHRAIPGTARENLSDDIPTSGTENYGWGAVCIHLFGEYLLGLRPVDALGSRYAFRPELPPDVPGDSFAVNNYPLLGTRVNIRLSRSGDGLDVALSAAHGAIAAAGAQGARLAQGADIRFHLEQHQECMLEQVSDI